MLTPHAEEYLEAIYRLGGQDGPVHLSSLAEHMALSAVSVNEMVRRLEEQSLVQYRPYVGTQLTEEGLCQALALLRRHRLWERFLTDVLGLSWDTVHEEACRLEHAASEQVTERLADLLHHPDRCPHGRPMPAADCTIVPLRQALPLAALQAGQRGEIAYIDREDPELLRYLESLGLFPSAQISVEDVGPFQGPLQVRVEGVPQVIGYPAASTVYIHLHPMGEPS
jgi:DtxR family Mn-dependent transcriptional regulator